jgi:hypothetical protein
MTSYCFMRFCKVLCQTWNHWRPEDLSWDQIGTQCYALDPDIVLTTCLHLTPYMHCSSGFSREFIRRCQLGSSFSPSRIAKHGGLPSIFEQTFICPHILKHIPRKCPYAPILSVSFMAIPPFRWINPIRSWTRSHFPSHGWQPAQLQLRLSSRLNVRCPYAGDDLEPKQLIRLGVMRKSSLPMFLECFWGSKMDKVHLWNGGHDDFMVSLWVFSNFEAVVPIPGFAHVMLRQIPVFRPVSGWDWTGHEGDLASHQLQCEEQKIPRVKVVKN